MGAKIGRRVFLGQTALGSAAAGMAMVHGAPAAEEPAASTLVLGVMGLSRGATLAVDFAKQPGVVVKYVCDADQTRAASCAKSIEQATNKSPEAIQDFRRILDDRSVDSLVCAAPNHWHAPATILACAAGKHVYVEKPCSHNPREGEWMVEAARKYGRAVQVGTQRRSGPGTREAIRLVREGILGRVYLVRSWLGGLRGSIGRGKPAEVPAHLNYDLWQGPAPRRPYVDNVVHYNWHWRWHWGNGELGNNGVHTLDLCRWGLGVDYPVRVTSSGGRYRYDDDQETPDTHTVCFEFEGKRAITWHGMSCNNRESGFVTFYGEQGTLELDSDGAFAIYDVNDKQVRQQAASSRGDAEHLANFLDAIRNDAPLSVNAEIEDGHKSALLCHLGNIAQRTGRTLNCNSSNGHILQDDDAMTFWSREYEKGWEPSV